MTKTITIDDDAYNKLSIVKKVIKDMGISSHTFSDSIRWLVAATADDERLTEGGTE